MLLIGAPIGSFIKKGGFGLPVIYSIVIFYFSTLSQQQDMIGKKIF